MKRLTILILSLLLPCYVLAETQSGTYGGEIQGVPVGVTKDRDMSFNVARVAGQTTYSNLNNVTSARFLVSGDPNSTFSLVFPSTVTLTRQGGSETVTVNIVCRMSQTGYVNSKTEGSDCTASPTLGSDGKMYLVFFPDQAQFQSDVVGTYIGTLTVTVNQ